MRLDRPGPEGDAQANSQADREGTGDTEADSQADTETDSGGTDLIREPVARADPIP